MSVGTILLDDSRRSPCSEALAAGAGDPLYGTGYYGGGGLGLPARHCCRAGPGRTPLAAPLATRKHSSTVRTVGSLCIASSVPCAKAGL